MHCHLSPDTNTFSLICEKIDEQIKTDTQKSTRFPNRYQNFKIFAIKSLEWVEEHAWLMRARFFNENFCQFNKRIGRFLVHSGAKWPCIEKIVLFKKYLWLMIGTTFKDFLHNYQNWEETSVLGNWLFRIIQKSRNIFSPPSGSLRKCQLPKIN